MHDPIYGDPEWALKVGPSWTNLRLNMGHTARLYKHHDMFVRTRRWFRNHGIDPFVPREFNGAGIPGFKS